MTRRTSRSKRMTPEAVKEAADRAVARAEGGEEKAQKVKRAQVKRAGKKMTEARKKKLAEKDKAEKELLAKEKEERHAAAEDERATLFPGAYAEPPEPIDPRKGASKYNPKIHPALARKLVQAGVALNETEMATFLSVHPHTIKAWQANHPEFLAACTIDDDDQITQVVERSLLRLATGYEYDSVKVFSHEGVPVYAPTVEHVTPNFQAQKYILENRAKDKVTGKPKWRDSKSIQVSGDSENPIAIDGPDQYDFARRMAYVLASAQANQPAEGGDLTEESSDD